MILYNGMDSNSWYSDLETSSGEFDDNEIKLDLGKGHQDDLSYLFIVPIVVICIGTLIYGNIYRLHKYVKCLKDKETLDFTTNETTNETTIV